MSHIAQPARIVIIYVMVTAAACLFLNYFLFAFKPEIELGHWMPLFGPAVFLLPIFWSSTLYFVGIFSAFYLFSSVLILTPVIIGWKRERHVRGANLLVGAAIWLVTGFFGTMMVAGAA